MATKLPADLQGRLWFVCVPAQPDAECELVHDMTQAQSLYDEIASGVMDAYLVQADNAGQARQLTTEWLAAGELAGIEEAYEETDPDDRQAPEAFRYLRRRAPI